MAQGLLKIQGRIALEQFWPTGESDAHGTESSQEVAKEALISRDWNMATAEK